jgi:hypothetical protein
LFYFPPYKYDQKKNVADDLTRFDFHAIQRHRGDPTFSMMEFQ